MTGTETADQVLFEIDKPRVDKTCVGLFDWKYALLGMKVARESYSKRGNRFISVNGELCYISYSFSRFLYAISKSDLALVPLF